MSDPPAIPRQHEKELNEKFPYTFYVWNRDTLRFELWCDEGNGGLPYKFMVLEGPLGEYRHPGGWVIKQLYMSDAETGQHRHASPMDRKAWIQGLTDESYQLKHRAERRDYHHRELKSKARSHHGWGVHAPKQHPGYVRQKK